MAAKTILFKYLHRDSANYKLFGSVVFTNPLNFSIEDVKRRIESKLIDGIYFDPDEWGVPRLRFEDYDEDLDHGWCEFDGVEETRKKGTRPIEEVIRQGTSIMVDFSVIYRLGDQPVTCPRCGARTDTPTDFFKAPRGAHVEQCLSPTCGFRFAVSNR